MTMGHLCIPLFFVFFIRAQTTNHLAVLHPLVFGQRSGRKDDVVRNGLQRGSKDANKQKRANPKLTRSLRLVCDFWLKPLKCFACQTCALARGDRILQRAVGGNDGGGRPFDSVTNCNDRTHLSHKGAMISLGSFFRVFFTLPLNPCALVSASEA